MKLFLTNIWLTVGATLLLLWGCDPGQGNARSAQASSPRIRYGIDSLDRYEAEIRRYEAQDAAQMPPKGVTLFVGSSSIRRWGQMAGDLQPLPVINRGFGGSTFPELNHYFDRLVLPYRPRLIVVCEGDNDLTEVGVKPEDVLNGLDRFVAQVEAKLPQAQVFMLAIKPSPSRRVLMPQAEQTNSLLQAYCDTASTSTFLDVYSPMLHADGRLRPELYAGDSLHLSRAGYELWTQVIKEPLLDAYAH